MSMTCLPFHGKDPWGDALEGVLDQVSATMKSRHAKYGPGNIAEHGMTGIKVRLGDKNNTREEVK